MEGTQEGKRRRLESHETLETLQLKSYDNEITRQNPRTTYNNTALGQVNYRTTFLEMPGEILY